MTDSSPSLREAWQQPAVVFRPLPYPGNAVRAPGTGLATASLVLGVAAMVLNLLLVPSILAIVFGIVSLAKGIPARGRAVAGIVLGAVGIPVAIGVAAAIAIPVFLGAQHAAVVNVVETDVVNDLSARGAGVTVVDCPVASPVAAGSTMTCSARTQHFGELRIDVTFRDARGAFSYTAAPAS